jgi:hypothetical protein
LTFEVSGEKGDQSVGSIRNSTSDQGRNASAPWEMWPFNKNQIGGVQRYGYPILLGPDENKEDTYGFCGDLYCPNCGTKSDFMLIEFRKPSADLMAAWMEINIDEIDEDILRCPKCGCLNLEPS